MMVSVSILSNKYDSYDLIKELNKTSADFIHLDIMDGKFVRNKTWDINEIKELVKGNVKKLDCHLMVMDPSLYIDEIVCLNPEYITFHYEAVKNVDEVIDLIKKYGIKVGISIKPETSLSEILALLSKIDMVLIMSVEPGKPAQEFINSSLDKVEELRKIIDINKYKIVISVDGGVNEMNAKVLKDKGCNILVSGSYVHENMEENIRKLQLTEE